MSKQHAYCLSSWVHFIIIGDNNKDSTQSFDLNKEAKNLDGHGLNYKKNERDTLYTIQYSRWCRGATGSKFLCNNGQFGVVGSRLGFRGTVTTSDSGFCREQAF